MENLARYIIRASFSQERMTYLPEESRIIYRSKDSYSPGFETLPSSNIISIAPFGQTNAQIPHPLQ
jgi:hypothetical protein